MKKTIALLLVLCAVVFADNQVVYEDPPAGMFFRDWLMCGPFPNPLPEGISFYMFDETTLGYFEDYLTKYGGEAAIQPVEGMKVKHPDGHTLKWEKYHGYYGLVNLDRIFTPKDQTVAYAACVVRSSAVKPMVMAITSNDAVRVWQNGELVLDHLTGGSEEPDRDLVPIVLKKGDNQFLVKIVQGFGKWSFQFRLLDMSESVKEMEERAYLFSRPKVTEMKDAYEIFVGQKYRVELASKVPALVKIMDVDDRHVNAEFDTHLGETLVLNKSDYQLSPGLHPVSCTVTKPGGLVHTLRSELFVGQAPDPKETLKQFKNVPILDSTNFLGQQTLNNYKCMDLQLEDDAKAGNLGGMDKWTQKKITDRYESWINKLKNAPSPYHKVFPEIQKIQINGNAAFTLPKEFTVTDLTKGRFDADINRIKNSLTEKHEIILKTGKSGQIKIGLKGQFNTDVDFPNDEAYKINVRKNSIDIIGADDRGLHFGLVTLKQLLDMNVPLPEAELFDFPIAAHRSAFQLLPVPMTDKWKNRILEYVDLKYNEIVVRSSDYRKMDDPKIASGIKEYFDFIRSFHIEPVPLLWLNGDFAWYEGFWLENEPITFVKDRCKLDVQLLVDLESSRPVLHSQINGGELYERDRDYLIVSTKPPIFERIPDGRIPKEITVYMDGDVVDRRSHRFSKPCSMEELAYKEFDRLAGPIIETLKPKMFHVNHDELGILNSDSRCKKQNKKDYELVAYQINRMRDIIKKHDPSVDMIMWADAVNPYHNAGIKALEKTCDLLYKDIIMAHWFYDAKDFKEVDTMEMGTKFFLDRGFRVYGCPWYHLVNHQAWERILLSYKNDPNFWGLMHTQWGDKDAGLAQTGAINWSGETWMTR